MLKKIMTGTVALATMFAFATSVTAGGLSDELMEPVVENVIEDDAVAAGSTPGWLVPALIIGAFILVASSSGDDDEVCDEACEKALLSED
jgi:hypothetical protein